VFFITSVFLISESFSTWRRVRQPSSYFPQPGGAHGMDSPIFPAFVDLAFTDDLRLSPGCSPIPTISGTLAAMSAVPALRLFREFLDPMSGRGQPGTSEPSHLVSIRTVADEEQFYIPAYCCKDCAQALPTPSTPARCVSIACVMFMSPRAASNAFARPFYSPLTRFLGTGARRPSMAKRTSDVW
jgi:hypothetical protein